MKRNFKIIFAPMREKSAGDDHLGLLNTRRNSFVGAFMFLA